jgi:hypothetical protein
MAEEKKPQEKRGSGLGERMSDISGMRVFRNGKWMSMAELPKAAKAPAPKAVVADADYGGECPPATRDIVLNVKNRQNAIDNVGYGPLNPKEPSLEFWQDKADKWSVSPEEAKKSICGNCVFFDIRPKTMDCIESGIAEGGSGDQSAWDAIAQAELGYCTALDFKCAASRTCNAWAVGGPVTEDKAPITSAGALVPEEQDLADALRVIVKQHGKFNEDNTGVWAGYDSAEKNIENAKIGVKCGNCVFWQSPNGCEIIDSKTEEGGLCRFAVLPDGTVTPEKVFSKYPDLTQEKLKKKINNMEDIYTEELLKISDLIPTQDYLTPIKLKGADDNTKLVTVYLDGEGYKLVDGHHRCAAKIMAGQNEIMAKVYREPLVATAGSKPAPKKDQVKGSDKNPKGSASGSKTINFSKKVEDSLSAKVREHNEKSDRKANLRMLKAVYRRGAGAFSSSHRPDQNRSSWAMARVNAFLHLLKSGSPKNSAYTTDNDLLPSSHPKSSKRSVTASADVEIDYDEYLSINLMSETEYTSKEHAIFSLAEYSDAGYEIIPALQASWLRAEKSNENAFERAKNLAVLLHDSKDADLLPKEF